MKYRIEKISNEVDNMNYSIERVIQIWNDTTGERIEIGSDRDGLELVEIRSYTDDGKVGQSMAMEKIQAIMLANSILALYHDEVLDQNSILKLYKDEDLNQK